MSDLREEKMSKKYKFKHKILNNKCLELSRRLNSLAFKRERLDKKINPLKGYERERVGICNEITKLMAQKDALQWVKLFCIEKNENE